jgi:hypothetical protein
MPVSEERISFDSIVDEVKALYVNSGENISRQEAVEAANNLVAFARVLLNIKDREIREYLLKLKCMHNLRTGSHVSCI